jgi:Cof subfamily protein (haloacid dehalogenase superfamily)
MDGTLLDSNGKVSEENQRAIQDFIEKGGKFGVATGRSQLNIVSFLKGISVNTPCILYNGGGLYDFETKEFLDISELSKKKLIIYLHHCLKQYPNVVIQIYTSDMCFVVSSKELANPAVIEDHQPCTFCQIEEIMDKPWIKILFCAKPDELKSMEEKIVKFELEQDVNWVFSSEIYLEFLPKDTSKGSMLKKLREYMCGGYKIYAVGDFNNDKEMLQAADVGIAVKNALPGVKDVADRITVSNDENAIADIIYHLIEN